MQTAAGANFGYRVAPTAEGWSWVCYGGDGSLLAQGMAPSRAVAAALVIRELARSHAPEGEALQGKAA